LPILPASPATTIPQAPPLALAGGSTPTTTRAIASGACARQSAVPRHQACESRRPLARARRFDSEMETGPEIGTRKNQLHFSSLSK